jgi:hypothetical protein
MPRSDSSRSESQTVQWRQESLFPPNIVDITIKIGAVMDTNHLQWLIESRDPKTGGLRSLTSKHHAPLSSLRPQLDQVLTEVLELIDPF